MAVRVPHLTTRALSLLTVAVVAGIVSLWSGAGADAWRMLIAALVLLFSIECWQASRSTPQLVAVSPDHGRLGRVLRYGLQIRNNSTASVRLRLLLAPPSGAQGEARICTVMLAPNDEAVANNDAVPAHLGPLQWEPIPLRMLGLLGLAWWERSVPPASATTVVPDTLGPLSRQAGRERGGVATARATHHGLELYGLRDYQPGDPLRMVDWKATARRGKPCVRLMSDENHLEILILLDCSRRSALRTGSLDRLGHAVNVAARLSETACANGDPVGLITYAEETIECLRPATGMRALTAVREALARARAQPTEASLLQATMRARRLLARRTLVVILSDSVLAEDGGQSLRALKLLTPQHLPLIAAINDEAVERLASAEADSWHSPFQILAATDLLHRMRVQQGRAQRLGTEVIATAADELDRALIARYQTLRRRRRV